MKSDYEVLGLKESADEKEIKRAYFKLIRQYSPEKDPERFQQIREAYENLIKGKGQTQLMLQIPDDPFAQKMFHQIETLYKQQDYEYALKTAEEAVRYYGECEGFMYYLALLQRKNYYTGKAAKNFEYLVKQYPENVEFAKQLAISYLERGYGKKAYEAYGKAYDMGCREIDFLNSYAINCKERKDYKRGMALLFELISNGRTDFREYILYLADAYGGLLILSRLSGGWRLEEIVDSLMEFLKDAVPYMSEYQEELGAMLGEVIFTLKSMNWMNPTFYEDVSLQLKKGLGQRKADELWKEIETEADYLMIEDDTRLSEVMKAAYECFVLMADDTSENAQYIRRFAILDCKLCILEEWPQIRAEFEIIKENYPIFYDAIKDYESTLEQTKNMTYLRNKLKKDYDRLSKYMSRGMYEMEYGYDTGQPKMITDDEYYDEPYVRDKPKVGRNDPCPCGSGKKYKKCCGKEN